MLGRFVSSILTLPWYWRVFLPAGLALVIGALLVLSLPTTPTMRAIHLVGGEVVVRQSPTWDAKFFSILRALMGGNQMGDKSIVDVYLGPRDPKRPESEQVYNEQLTDEVILQLDMGSVGELRLVDMSGPHVTDRGFSHITGNSGANFIICRHAQVSDTGLVSLAVTNPNLYSVDLTGNPITDAGLSLMSHFPNDPLVNPTIRRLNSLKIGSTEVTDAGLSDRSILPRLVNLGVDTAQFTDVAVSSLRSLSLSSLAVQTCSEKKKNRLRKQGIQFQEVIDDQVIARISQLNLLYSIELSGNAPGEPAQLTSASVKILASMPRLASLLINDLQVDPAVLRQIRKELPRVQVFINGKPQ